MDTKRYQQTKRITLIGALVNAILGIGKIATGYFGQSQALIADGVHSLSDLLTDGIVIIAARFGGQKPDKEHPYGHGRIETVATVIVAVILIAVGLGIAYDALAAILRHERLLRPDFYVIVVAMIAIIAKEIIYRYTLRVADRIESNLLRANAWHHRSDVYVSLIVLVGVVGAWFGVIDLDAVAAIIIGLFIVKIGWKMIWSSVQELIDTAVAPDLLESIKKTIKQVPGVITIHQLRTRSLAGSVFVDVHVLVNETMSVSEGHFISDQVYKSLLNQFNKIADVTVHIDPEDDEVCAPSSHLPNRQAIEAVCEQRWQDLPGFSQRHRLLLHYLDGKVNIELVLPLAAIKNAEQAQQLAKQYQQSIADLNYIRLVLVNYHSGGARGQV